MAFSNIRQFHTNNVNTFQRSPLSEISGSLGDLGTLLPLMITLVSAFSKETLRIWTILRVYCLS